MRIFIKSIFYIFLFILNGFSNPIYNNKNKLKLFNLNDISSQNYSNNMNVFLSKKLINNDYDYDQSNELYKETTKLKIIHSKKNIKNTNSYSSSTINPYKHYTKTTKNTNFIKIKSNKTNVLFNNSTKINLSYNEKQYIIIDI